MFFLSGFEKIYYFAQSSGKFAKKMGLSLTLAQLVISCVILLEISAPTVIAAYLYTGLASLVPFFKLALMALAAFTILATMLYHNPLKGKEKYYAFMSNVSTLGGLLALYVAA
jgi:membrane protein implicated in regulation of membrane protease activity